MPQQEQKSGPPAPAYYIPIDERPMPDVTEDRSREQIKADNNYQPVMPRVEGHPHGARIAEIEARLAKQKRDEAFGQCKNSEERELFTLREIRERDERTADEAADVARHKASVKPETDRLRELRSQLTLASERAAIDKATKQLEAPGADKKVGEKMIAQIFENEKSKKQDHYKELAARRDEVQRELAALEKELVSPTPKIKATGSLEKKAFEVEKAMFASTEYTTDQMREFFAAGKAHRQGDSSGLEKLVEKYVEDAE